jgi:transcriptional regulator GlxA family with amidase domain
MLSELTGATTASQRVGYLSASQFSRDYSRFFRNAPTRDIARLYGQGFMAANVTR